SNIPLGSPIPANALFHLRSVTLKFGGIPSLLRYSVAVPVPTYLIGLQTFLDNPLLFYCHHDFFLTGSDAFNKIADDVNTRDPNVQWTSLGDIVRHFYLVKLRDDSDYDVSAYSSEFDLENVAQRKVVFHVRKLEADSRRVASLIVDGDPQPFVSSRDGYLEVDITLPAGHTSRVKVEYEPVLLPAVEIDKRSPRVYLLRTASEFRDNVLYRAFMGRTLITLYYRNGAA